MTARDNISRPLVSVITSTYNRAEILQRAIDSVRAQTFTGWEHIIVGDRTPDHTADVVASYDDPRLRFYNLPEKSPPGSHGAVAKNYGIQKMASGKYIAYLDDDDAYGLRFLEVMVDYLEAHQDAQIAYCRSLYRDKQTGRRILGNPFQRWMHGYSKEKLQRYNLMSSHAVMHRKTLLQEVGYWNPAMYFDDYDLWLRISQKYEFHYINQALVETYVTVEPFLVRLFAKGWQILRHGRHTPRE